MYNKLLCICYSSESQSGVLNRAPAMGSLGYADLEPLRSPISNVRTSYLSAPRIGLKSLNGLQLFDGYNGVLEWRTWFAIGTLGTRADGISREYIRHV